MNESKQFLPIGEASAYLGIAIATLRRWHKDGTFPASFVSPGKHLYYSLADLQRHTKGLLQTALDWARGIEPESISEEWYCATSDVFKARLERMTTDLLTRFTRADRAPLLASAAGEIGNNSFDHNLGKWPDTPGVFFAYDLGKSVIVLADRGVGILSTLRRVRPALATHTEAVRVAFTEVITGRAPEHRGNGLKYVRRAVHQADAALRFWTGDALLAINNDQAELAVSQSSSVVRGCVAVLEF